MKLSPVHFKLKGISHCELLEVFIASTYFPFPFEEVAVPAESLYLNFLSKSKLWSTARIQIQLIPDESREGWSGIFQMKLDEDRCNMLYFLRRSEKHRHKMGNNSLGTI